MVDQHPLLRASGATRMLAVLALLAGIVAMHAGVFALPSGAAHHAATSGLHDASGTNPAEHTAGRGHDNPLDAGTPPQTSSAGTGCGGADCDTGHAGLHGCVFILTTLGLALMLVLLYYVAAVRADGLRALPRLWRAERERPPPWTVLFLAELSILRI
ncbi:DUF6153 family protein [Nocardia goodfellowii]